MHEKTHQRVIVNPYPIVQLTTQRAIGKMHELVEISKPLHLLGVQHFTYGRIVKNVRCLNVSNHPSYLNNLLENVNKYPVHDFLEYWLSALGFKYPRHVFSSHDVIKKISKDSDIIMLQCAHSMYNPVSIPLFDDRNDTVEIFSFYASTTEASCLYRNLSQVGQLANFILYFKEKAHKLLCEIELTTDEQQNFLSNPANTKELPLKRPSLSSQANEIDFKIKCYDLGSPFTVSLSLREFACLKMAYVGMTAKQIAKIIPLSYRTVEKHLANIRIKANNRDLSDIRQMLFQNSFFQLLIRK